MSGPTESSVPPNIPAGKVSRNLPDTDPSKWKDVGLARVSIDYSMGAALCSCGWARSHPRAKVLGDKAQRHLDKRHKGRGIWL